MAHLYTQNKTKQNRKKNKQKKQTNNNNKNRIYVRFAYPFCYLEIIISNYYKLNSVVQHVNSSPSGILELLIYS